MSVSHSGHSVDLEVLVRTAGGDRLDGTPVGPRWLGIIKPFVSKSLHVVGVEVRNSLGDLTARNTASLLNHLDSDLFVDGSVVLSLHHLVVKSVAATDDFNVVHEMSVNGGEADTTVVHLTGEYFVSEEVVSENTSVGV